MSRRPPTVSYRAPSVVIKDDGRLVAAGRPVREVARVLEVSQPQPHRRVLAPVAEEAGAPWASFHTFRHTAASLLFERGANAKQVQRWLGHHSAAFTLARYVHLLTDHPGDPLDLQVELPGTAAAAAAAGRLVPLECESVA